MTWLMCEQQRCRSACASAQSDQFLCFSSFDSRMPLISISDIVMILSFRTKRPGQTVQTQIRLLLEEQSDQGLQCLQFHLHLF